MKQKIILSGILIAWLLAAIMVLSSCNISKHVTKTSTDSTSVQHHDSSNVTISDQTKSEGSSTSDSNGIQIDFYRRFKPVNNKNIDSGVYKWIKDNETNSGTLFYKPVEDTSKNNDNYHVDITPDGNGGYNINSDAPIKSIKTKSNKTTEQHKTNDSSTSKTVVINTSDSTHLEKKVKIKDVETKPSLLKWVGLFVLIGVVVVIVYKIYMYFNPEAKGISFLFGLLRRKKEKV